MGAWPGTAPVINLPGMNSMSMLQTMNAALLSQGFDEIVSVEDGSDEYRVLARNWPTIVGRELEDGRYQFSRVELVLNNRTDGEFGFEDRYLLPSDTLHVRNAYRLDNGCREEILWSQAGLYVHVDAPAGITVEAYSAPGIDLWSHNFAYGVQKRLEAVLCRVREDAAGAREADGDAEVAFQRARTHSSQAHSPSSAYRRSPMAAARFRRG